MEHNKYSYDEYQSITRETSGCDDLSILALGLIGESIEFINAVDATHSSLEDECLMRAIQNTTKEAGDVLWYSARLMDVMKISFSSWPNHTAGTTDNFNDSCRKSFRKKFRIAKNAAAISEHVKKVVGHGHELDSLFICDHIGDIIRDVSYLMKGIYGNSCLDIVMHTNVEKLRHRYPDGFDTERSKNRSLRIL